MTAVNLGAEDVRLNDNFTIPPVAAPMTVLEPGWESPMPTPLDGAHEGGSYQLSGGAFTSDDATVWRVDAPETSRHLMVLAVPELDRRNMLLMSGLGLLAAAVPLPSAVALPSSPIPEAPAGGYLYVDEFDGPAARPPIRRTGPSRTGRRRLAAGGQSVPRRPPERLPRRQLEPGDPRDADARHLLQRQGARQLASAHGPHLGGAGQTRLHQRWGVARLLGGERDPLPDGEVDIMEYYGNMSWPPVPRCMPRPTARPGEQVVSPV